MDELDIKIIQLLMFDSRLSYRELGDYIGLSLNAVYKRVQNLIDSEIIKKFIVRINAYSIGAIYVFLFGMSNTSNIDKTVIELEKIDSITNVLLTSRNYMYIGGFLRNIHELGDFSSRISKIADIHSPIIGLRDGSFYNCPIPFIIPKSTMLRLDPLDMEIVKSLKHDARKTIADLAKDIESTPQTTRRHLKRLMEEGIIESTIEFYPEASEDLFSILLIELSTNVDRIQTAKILVDKYSPSILYCWTFSNLPHTLLCWVWTNSIRQLNDLLEKLKKEDIDSVVTDIIRKSIPLETWLDELPDKKLI